MIDSCTVNAQQPIGLDLRLLMKILLTKSGFFNDLTNDQRHIQDTISRLEIEAPKNKQ